MGTTNIVQITLEVDDKGTPVIKGFSDKIKDTSVNITQQKSVLGSFNAVMKDLRERYQDAVIGVTIFTGAVYTGIRILKAFVDAAAEAEAIENQLRFTLENQGRAWSEVKVEVEAFATSIQKMTRFSDDQALQSLDSMSLYTRDFAQAQWAANLAMDLSVKKRIDLTTAERYVGMAMTGNIEVLGRMMPEFRHVNDVLGENATLDEKAAYGMKELQRLFGGAARNDVNTYAGAVSQLNNSWSDLIKVIGKDLLPTLKDAAKEAKSLIDGIKEYWSGIKSVIEWAYKLSPVGMGAAAGQWMKQKAQEYGVATGAIKPDWSKSYEWGKGESTAPGAGETLDPYVKKYGMSESELQDRLSRANLAHEAWKQAYGIDEESVARANYALQHILEGEKEFAREYAEAWAAVYQIQADEDAEWTEKHKYAQEKILEGEKQFAQDYIDAWAYVYQVQADEDAEWTEKHKYAQEKILEGEKEFANDVAQAWSFVGKEETDQAVDQFNRTNQFWSQTATSMGQSFMSGFFNIFTSGLDRAGEAFEKFGMNLLNSFANIVQQLISNWIMFGSVMGSSGFSKGQSFGGILGLFGLTAAEGLTGWANGPTPILAGEAGREFVNIIPESEMGKGGMGGQTIVNYTVHNHTWNAIDLQTSREWVRRNKNLFVGVIDDHLGKNGILRKRK